MQLVCSCAPAPDNLPHYMNSLQHPRRSPAGLHRGRPHALRKGLPPMPKCANPQPHNMLRWSLRRLLGQARPRPMPPPPQQPPRPVTAACTRAASRRCRLVPAHKRSSQSHRWPKCAGSVCANIHKSGVVPGADHGSIALQLTYQNSLQDQMSATTRNTIAIMTFVF